MELQVGIRGEITKIVSPSMSAKAAQSGEMEVLATPFAIAMMEQAAAESVKPYLSPKDTTVGTKVDMCHIAATPVGKEAVARSELVAVEGKKLTFSVSVYDGGGKVAEGTHQRFIVNKNKFMEKANGRGV